MKSVQREEQVEKYQIRTPNLWTSSIDLRIKWGRGKNSQNLVNVMYVSPLNAKTTDSDKHVV